MRKSILYLLASLLLVLAFLTFGDMIVNIMLNIISKIQKECTKISKTTLKVFVYAHFFRHLSKVEVFKVAHTPQNFTLQTSLKSKKNSRAHTLYTSTIFRFEAVSKLALFWTWTCFGPKKRHNQKKYNFYRECFRF